MVKNIKEHLKQLKRLRYMFFTARCSERFWTPIDLSLFTLQWANIKKWRRGSDRHFHTNHWSLSTRASSWCLCLQECGIGLLLLIYVVKCDYKKNEAHATETKLASWNSKRRLLLRRRLLTSDFSIIFQQIDGEAFLLLNQGDIVNILKIKLGPALKIFNTIPKFWCYLNCN